MEADIPFFNHLLRLLLMVGMTRHPTTLVYILLKYGSYNHSWSSLMEEALNQMLMVWMMNLSNIFNFMKLLLMPLWWVQKMVVVVLFREESTMGSRIKQSCIYGWISCSVSYCSLMMLKNNKKWNPSNARHNSLV